MRRAISRRPGTLSTPMTSEAPDRRAPAVAHRPMGPSAKTATASPMRTCPRSAAEKPVDMMSGHMSTSSSERSVGDAREVRLGRGDDDVLALAAVDRVAEAPSADGLEAFAAVAALRAVAREARPALAARRDGSDDDAVARREPDDARAEGLDPPDRLVTDDEPGPDRVLALEDVHVGAADRRQRDADERLARSGLGTRDLAQLDLALLDEHCRSHRGHDVSPVVLERITRARGRDRGCRAACVGPSRSPRARGREGPGPGASRGPPSTRSGNG